MTTVEFQFHTVPLSRWPDGSIRVGDSRVLVDLVIHAFNDGRTPEEIVINYPTLRLSDVYVTISYYLANQAQLDSYVASRQQEADALWGKINSNPAQKEIREKLLNRRAKNTS